MASPTSRSTTASGVSASRTRPRISRCRRSPEATSASRATRRASTGARSSSCDRTWTRSRRRAGPPPTSRPSPTSRRADGWPGRWRSSATSTPRTPAWTRRCEWRTGRATCTARRSRAPWRGSSGCGAGTSSGRSVSCSRASRPAAKSISTSGGPFPPRCSGSGWRCPAGSPRRCRCSRTACTWAWRLLGDLASRGGAPALAEAEQHYRQSLGIAEELRMQPVVAHAKLGLGRTLRLAGDRAGAEENLVTAFLLFRAMDVPYWVKKCGEEMMQLGEIFVVARYNPQLYDYLQREFSHEERIRIIMDRRVGERRQRGEAPPSDRRQADRRRHQEVDANLRERGVVILQPGNGGSS